MKPLQMKLSHFSLTLLCFLILAIGCQKNKGDDNGQNAIVLNDNNGEDYNPIIEPANFVDTIDNPYLTLTPGRVWVYEGKNKAGKTERVEVEVTRDTKKILGVITTVVRDRAWKDGKLVEDTFDWFAQDKSGNVWYLGEDSKEIRHGEVVSTAGSWEAGVNGAKPGIVMKANPQVGDAHRMEFLKGEAEDMAQVLSIDEPVSIGFGNYKNCLQLKEWAPLKPDLVEHKFYSKEIGNVILEKKVAGGSGQLELIAMKSE
jgi:hypothetical protein